MAAIQHFVSPTALLQSAHNSASTLRPSSALCTEGKKYIRLHRDFNTALKRPRSARVSVSSKAVDISTRVDVDILPSGEWPESYSMLNYEDLSTHYAPAIFKKEAQPNTLLADIMSRKVWSAHADTTLEEVRHHFIDVTGVPVVDEGLNCIGVLSRKDVTSMHTGHEKAGSVMSSPAITITAGNTVKDAAILMLREKVHRLPVVNESNKVVGIVTRTDIFTALEGLPSRDSENLNPTG